MPTETVGLVRQMICMQGVCVCVCVGVSMCLITLELSVLIFLFLSFLNETIFNLVACRSLTVNQKRFT